MRAETGKYSASTPSARASTAASASASRSSTRPVGARSILLMTTTRAGRAGSPSARSASAPAPGADLADRAFEHGAVARTDCGGGIDHRHDHVDVGQGTGGGVVQARAELAPGPVDAGCIDEDDLRIGRGVVEDTEDAVPGRVGSHRGDGDLGTHHGVDEGGLADVGPADDGHEAGSQGAIAPWAMASRSVPSPLRRRGRLDPDPPDAPAPHDECGEAEPVDLDRIPGSGTRPSRSRIRPPTVSHGPVGSSAPRSSSASSTE